MDDDEYEEAKECPEELCVYELDPGGGVNLNLLDQKISHAARREISEKGIEDIIAEAEEDKKNGKAVGKQNMKNPTKADLEEIKDLRDKAGNMSS